MLDNPTYEPIPQSPWYIPPAASPIADPSASNISAPQITPDTSILGGLSRASEMMPSGVEPWPYGIIVVRNLKHPPNIDDNYVMADNQAYRVHIIVTGIKTGSGAYTDSTKSVNNLWYRTRSQKNIGIDEPSLNDLRGIIYGAKTVSDVPLVLNIAITTAQDLLRIMSLATEGMGAYTAIHMMHKIDIYFTHVIIRDAIISKVGLSLVDIGAEGTIEIISYGNIEWIDGLQDLPIEKAYADNGKIYGPFDYINRYECRFIDNDGALAELPQCAVMGVRIEFAENIRITGSRSGPSKIINITTYSPPPPLINIEMAILGNAYQYSASNNGTYDNMEQAFSQYRNVCEVMDGYISSGYFIEFKLASGLPMGILPLSYESTQSQLMQGRLVMSGQIVSMAGTALGMSLAKAVEMNRDMLEKERKIEAFIGAQKQVVDIIVNRYSTPSDNIDDVYGAGPMATGEVVDPDKAETENQPDPPYDPTTMPIPEGEEDKYWGEQMDARISYLHNKYGIYVDPNTGKYTELRRLTKYRTRRRGW